ncbi:hypothetical protein [Rhodococcus sp. UNC363MFTsu5.1]|uniref:hypothetical protein n=1 Tax=Rhodococcus sp. UNC363MFTsu5.1 TaxID=1449069 RepID=UPI000488101A|nr:hypothetical protein [Rhodococcus sp. UNC363MFTsu5.1]
MNRYKIPLPRHEVVADIQRPPPVVADGVSRALSPALPHDHHDVAREFRTRRRPQCFDSCLRGHHYRVRLHRTEGA